MKRKILTRQKSVKATKGVPALSCTKQSRSTQFKMNNEFRKRIGFSDENHFTNYFTVEYEKKNGLLTNIVIENKQNEESDEYIHGNTIDRTVSFYSKSLGDEMDKLRVLDIDAGTLRFEKIDFDIHEGNPVAIIHMIPTSCSRNDKKSKTKEMDNGNNK